MTKKSDKEYWEDYNNLQRVKHELIRTYVNGWLPKLTLGDYGSGRVLYFVTHAGRGKHAQGQLGSPLIALETILNHSAFPKLTSEIKFFFIEEKPENHATLEKELKAYQPLPNNVEVHCEHGDCFELLTDIVDSLKKEGKRLAPSFVFCDPFGFTVPFSVLTELMKFQRVELFVNVIWREMDMAIARARREEAAWVTKMNSVFDGDGWREINSLDHDTRAEQCVHILREKVGAKWATYIRMLGKNDATRYFLVHLSNHDKGREYMKECMWKACPDVGFFARVKDDPRQQYLIKPEPDLSKLEADVIQRLADGPVRWSVLTEEMKEEIWLPKHLNEVIRKLRKEGAIEGSHYDGKFVPKSNPLLRLKH